MMSKDLTKYVLVPYEEYHRLTKRLKKLELEGEEAIFYKRLFPKNYKRNWSLDWYQSFDGVSYKDGFVTNLEISARLFNALNKEYENPVVNNKRFMFVGDLVSLKWTDVLKMDQVGRKSFNELREVLKENNLMLQTKLPQHITDRLEELRKQ